MTTQWTVIAPASHIILDAHRRGGIPISVTNAGQAADVAVFGAVAGDGADPSWFTVADPQRPVPPGGSQSYLLGVAVPDTVPPGRYAVAGRVYSANQPPEETSRTSGWIVFDVVAAGASPSAPPRPPRPPSRRLWPIAVAVAAGLVAVLVLGWAVVWPRLFEKHEGVIEAEDMRLLVQDRGFVGRQTCCDLPSASGSAYLLVDGWEPGQSGTAEFYLPDGGRFRISAIRSMSWDHGIVVLAIDGERIGGEFDGYQPNFGFTGWDTVGTVKLDQGPHELTLTVVGQSAYSGGFDGGLDAIHYEST